MGGEDLRLAAAAENPIDNIEATLLRFNLTIPSRCLLLKAAAVTFTFDTGCSHIVENLEVVCPAYLLPANGRLKARSLSAYDDYLSGHAKVRRLGWKRGLGAVGCHRGNRDVTLFY